MLGRYRFKPRLIDEFLSKSSDGRAAFKGCDSLAGIKMCVSLQSLCNTNSLWPLATRSNIVRKVHIDKHFVIKPVAAAGGRGITMSQRRGNKGKQENKSASWTKVVMLGGWRELKNKKTPKKMRETESWATQTAALQGFFFSFSHSEVMQLFSFKKKGGFLRFLSLSPFPCLVQWPSRSTETLISLSRDNYTRTQTCKHTGCWLHGFCYQVLVQWSSSLLKNNERAVSQTGRQTATVCFPIT